ncbi:MAG: ABC transporter ATP-binding protein [Candidatus Krumholzibacteriia bacterium]
MSRKFGPIWALRNVSFAVGGGEIVGFLGPNGAGKTTTMRILTGSLAPTAGYARVAGFDILDRPLEVRRRIGFMPEHAALHPDQSVRAYLDFVADVKGVPPNLRRPRLDWVLERTGLTGVAGKLVGNLSQGFRKRACLAQALVGDPDVLILDEPTSGLDPHQIVEIRELIRSFRGKRTVLFSSHILSEVGAVCQRVLILNGGRLVGQNGSEGLDAADLARIPAGKPRVVLSWDGNREGVEAALRGVTGVDDILLTESGAEVLIAGNPVEIRPKLVESVVNAGGLLQNLHDKGPSLEDLFLRLTGADVPEAGEPGNGSAGEEP